MLIVPFMSVPQFSRLTKMGVKQIKARMDAGEIPEVKQRKERATRYVDLVTLAKLINEGKLEFSNLDLPIEVTK
ncbi:hypothetical protein [uncultured Vibrio sp.]|uniref:hypothetical protein n=1 Tax=uncultured Vibrio sp. TaxID=114054 RepID=UPI00260C9BDC|nr:hypothetical protein [uncultured Vibrio sp.]